VINKEYLKDSEHMQNQRSSPDELESLITKLKETLVQSPSSQRRGKSEANNSWSGSRSELEDMMSERDSEDHHSPCIERSHFSPSRK